MVANGTASTMRATIDGAGRLVVPEASARRARLRRAAPNSSSPPSTVRWRCECRRAVRIEDGPHGLHFVADDADAAHRRAGPRADREEPAVTADTSVGRAGARRAGTRTTRSRPMRLDGCRRAPGARPDRGLRRADPAARRARRSARGGGGGARIALRRGAAAAGRRRSVGRCCQPSPRPGSAAEPATTASSRSRPRPHEQVLLDARCASPGHLPPSGASRSARMA